MAIFKETKKYLSIMGFTPINGSTNRYQRAVEYKNKVVNRFTVSINQNSGSIDWGKVIVQNKRSSNLSKKEYLVQLFWVIKLIECGYRPENIIIESEVQLGRKRGYIDLVVNDQNGVPFLILDAKKDLDEYTKYASELRKCEGQIASYFAFDNRIKYIGVISAEFLDDFVDDYSFIVSTNGWEEKGSAAAYSKFLKTKNKSLENEFSIDVGLEPYDNKLVVLKQENLQEIDEKTSSFIFHRFLTILRKHGISDKTNAFNRILNLFIAKIVDEFNTPNNTKLKFQISTDETNEEFISKIESLYSQGLRDFIQIHIDSDIDIKNIKLAIENKLDRDIDNQEKEKIFKMIVRLQSKNSPNFQFEDVYDDKTYNDNIELLKELVQLIAPFRFKYAKKQQFLGDFFENILSSGFKQEAGQFFTPVPLAKFMVESLPLEQKTEEILKDDENPRKLLPVMIDFASGSGHFLTEYMDKIQSVINNVETGNLSSSNKRKFEEFINNPFTWSNKYVYGLDIDYRLVKTAKVSSFLNGDGDALIRRGNGLSSFNSPDYKGVLHMEHGVKNNHNFDILIANPPYSVDDFQSELPNMNNDFELAQYLTESSSQIETLFIERASQLLKENGLMAIVLPSAILDTTSLIYTEARKFLLRKFEIKAIMKNPKITFSATRIETVTIFAQKREEGVYEKLQRDLKFDGRHDIAFNGEEHFVTRYIKRLFGNSFSFENYIEFYSGNLNFDNQIVQQYKDKYGSLTKDDLVLKIQKSEKERMLYFALLSNSVVIIKAPSNKPKDEEILLGYSFSERRGYEGIHPRIKNYTIEDLTLLYGSKGYYLNEIVKASFLNALDEIEDNEVIKPYYRIIYLHQLVDFNDYTNGIVIKVQNAFENYVQDYGDKNTISLKEYANLDNGTAITADQFEVGNIPVIAGGKQPAYYINESNRDGDVITVSKSGNAGYLAYHADPIFCSDSFTIRAKENSPYTTKELYYLLKNKQKSIYNFASGSVQKHVYTKNLEYFRIPKRSAESKEIVSVLKEKFNNQLQRELKIQKLNDKKQRYINDFVDKHQDRLITLAELENKNIYKVSGGKRIPKEMDYAPFKTKHYYPTIANYENGSINLNESKYIDDQTFETIKKYTLDNLDVFVSIAGTIGKIGIKPKISEDYTISLTENAGKIETKSTLERDYLARILLSENIQKQMFSMVTKKGTPKLSLASLRKIAIPWVSEKDKSEFINEILKFDEKIQEFSNKKDV